MRYYNADGGEAEMCGNGARCFARFAERTAGAKKKVSFETPAGIIRAKVDGEMVCPQMSDPKDLRSDVEISAVGEKFRGHSIDTGVPHFVISVDKIDDVDVVKMAALSDAMKHFRPEERMLISSRSAAVVASPSVPTNGVWKMKRSRVAPALSPAH